MNPYYPAVADRAGHRCEYCHAPEAIFNLAFEVEHIIPVALQGPDDESNRALACRSCNRHKSDHVTGTDESTGATVSLYHPRRDRWDDLFRTDKETGVLVGLTSIGRATVARLRMNRPAQQEARLQWIRLGLFP